MRNGAGLIVGAIVIGAFILFGRTAQASTTLTSYQTFTQKIFYATTYAHMTEILSLLTVAQEEGRLTEAEFLDLYNKAYARWNSGELILQ